jgi:hypothetical protein
MELNLTGSRARIVVSTACLRMISGDRFTAHAWHAWVLSAGGGGTMDAPTNNVRRFFEARADRYAEPYRHIGGGKEFAELPRPDEYVAAPPAVLEACGFYFLNVLKRDNGSVYVFQADAAGTPAFGVLATSDGSDAHLEVYGAAGELIGAALVDRSRSAVVWSERDAVRRRAGIEGFE